MAEQEQREKKSLTDEKLLRKESERQIRDTRGDHRSLKSKQSDKLVSAEITGFWLK